MFVLHNAHRDPQPIIHDCHLHSVDRKRWSVYCVHSFSPQPPYTDHNDKKALSVCVAYLYIFHRFKSLDICFIDTRFKAFSLYRQPKGKNSSPIPALTVFPQNMLHCASLFFLFFSNISFFIYSSLCLFILSSMPSRRLFVRSQQTEHGMFFY